jgi:hypothetical protein
MTVLQALAILEAAVLECKKRDINTPEVKNALDLLERYIWPKWLIPQFRHDALKEGTDDYVDREGQQQVLRATFPGIRDCVRELLRVRMAALAVDPWIIPQFNWHLISIRRASNFDKAGEHEPRNEDCRTDQYSPRVDRRYHLRANQHAGGVNQPHH